MLFERAAVSPQALQDVKLGSVEHLKWRERLRQHIETRKTQRELTGLPMMTCIPFVQNSIQKIQKGEAYRGCHPE